MSEEKQPVATQFQLPADYPKCPVCGHDRRIANTIAQREKAKGRMPADMNIAAASFTCPMANPKTPPVYGQKYPVVRMMLDACCQCGTVWVVHAEEGEMSFSVNNSQLKQFGFPQKYPGMS